MVSSADAARLRRAQVGIRKKVERDLDRMWSRIWSQIPAGPTQAPNVRDAFLRQMPVLVARYGEEAATVAADWYELQRARAGVGGAFRASLASSPYGADAVEGAVRRTAAALWTPRPEAMREGLKSAAGKYVLGASRATIQWNVSRDPRASGWERVTSGDSCEFCEMLAGRGAVYKDDTVHFAAHKSCNCAAVPSWDPSAPEVDVEMYQASERTTHMSPEAREQHNALIRRAINEYVR